MLIAVSAVREDIGQCLPYNAKCQARYPVLATGTIFITCGIAKLNMASLSLYLYLMARPGFKSAISSY